MGEITIVIKGLNKGDQKSEYDATKLKRELYDLIDAGLNLSEASRYLAKKNNLTKRLIYSMYTKSNNFS